MPKSNKPRLRIFEEASNQRHIVDGDRYLYKSSDIEPPIRFNIIGTGMMGQEHMKVATLLGEAKIHGVFDINKHSLDIAADEFKKYAHHKLVQYPDLESTCLDPEVEALLICTPNYTHHEVLKVALKSGKPILLEKPMATNLADAADIFNLANKYSSFIQIGLQYRYKAQYKEAFEASLNQKILGDIKTINLSEFRPPFLDKVEQWNKFSEFSGGTLVEKCCHYFDLINLFADSIPNKIYASGGQAINFLDFEKNNQKSDIDDHAFVIIDYENGTRANFTLNMFCPSFSEELILCGDKGKLVASEHYDFQRENKSKSTISIDIGESGPSKTSDVHYPILIEQSGHNGATFFEHIEFINQLKGKDSDCATPLQGLWSIIIACAAQESILKETYIMIDEFLDQNKLGWVTEK
tara:strand:+ start:2630 stop:3859 length:1230 start_codon:yes stop_codon:yes gene_type:complete